MQRTGKIILAILLTLALSGCGCSGGLDGKSTKSLVKFYINGTVKTWVSDGDVTRYSSEDTWIKFYSKGKEVNLHGENITCEEL